MAKAGYSVITTADVTVTTAKSILGVRSHANFGLDLTAWSVEFAGTAADAAPVLVELCYATFATNAPGTNSTSRTPAQNYGRTVAVGATAASNWTAEPTVLTVIEEHRIHPQAGIVIQYPLGQSPDAAVSEGFVLRVTAAASVTLRATMRFERC